MCAIDDGEPVEFYDTRTAKARKVHRCHECHRDINPGEIYRIDAGKFDGDFFTYKTCPHCSVAIEWLNRECGGSIFGGAHEDIREHWIDGGIRTRELALLIWGMSRGWTKRRGGLMAIPVLAVAEAVR